MRLDIIRILMIFLLTSFMSLSLSGCGFRPLYGESPTNPGVYIAEIKVAHIDGPEPVAFYVQEEVSNKLTPNGPPASPKYELTMSVTERRQPLGIQIDASVTRFNYNLSGRYVLRDLSGACPNLKGRARSIVSYNVVKSQFATLIAERDAQEKAAIQMGAEIQTNLAIHFYNLRRKALQNAAKDPTGSKTAPLCTTSSNGSSR